MADKNKINNSRKHTAASRQYTRKFNVTIFISVFILTSCFSLNDTSTNTLIKESPNPRLDKKVILFVKEPGATSADSYHITICDTDHELGNSEIGNVFIVDTNHDNTVLDTASINFTWFGNDTLQIDYDQKLRTFVQNKNVGKVTIIYKPR